MGRGNDRPAGAAQGGPAGTTPAQTRQSVRVADDLDDPGWDQFLRATGYAHHTQSSVWAQTKVREGWEPLRVIVERGGCITAGAQLLCRQFAGVGGVAYLPRGPVAAAGDPAAADAVMVRLGQVVREARIHAVLIEPDPTTATSVRGLAADGLVATRQRLSLGATTVVDLTRDPDALLAGMRTKTRYNIRVAERRGVEVRHGGADDLPTFHRLLVATGQRQGFEAPSLDYFRRWFELLGARGHLQLFLAEYGGEPVSGMLGVTFGSTFVYKRGAWSGEHSGLHPNEALHWAAMRWARDAGYRRYDFDGIERSVAERVAGGHPLPKEAVSSVTRFKLGFGGEVILLPSSRLLLPGRFQRRLYRLAGRRLERTRVLRRRLRGALVSARTV
ncbi:lipid II:glycine glycyltransferase FemX [Egicoccus sp. AB-alg2]|uniref:lipid II:glycine glycyltransferase FemX n=1 Tax=Egicoccus sp. AB-alg2 TaxID=3242693 RepID=UPI00359E1CD9